VWQVWDGQLSPAFKSIRLKAFGGWKFDRGPTKLHARILRGKGVQKKKPNMFTVGSSTSATFVLPVYVVNPCCFSLPLSIIHGFESFAQKKLALLDKLEMTSGSQGDQTWIQQSFLGALEVCCWLQKVLKCCKIVRNEEQWNCTHNAEIRGHRTQRKMRSFFKGLATGCDVRGGLAPFEHQLNSM